MEKKYTRRDVEVAYCIGVMNRMLTIDELHVECKTMQDKIDNLITAIDRGDFDPIEINKQNESITNKD